MTGASSLQHTVTLSSYDEVDDGMGNSYGEWVARLNVHASFKHMNGNETVMAGRLQGRHAQVFRIRASEAARLITTEWKITYRRTDFNIRDITPTKDRKWLDILAESGVAV